jgi:dimethylamine/trimethylamine dehydrogenase
MGEEWRRGWHPEHIPSLKSPTRVLVVGAGPAGLEAARALGQRGAEVTLVDASRELGGRVSREARLPGLAEWARVRDWRVGRIQRMSQVAVYPDNRLGVDDVLGFGAERVVIATGCHWRRDGFGRSNDLPIDGLERPEVFTPDDILDGRLPAAGPVLLFDDDGFYLASVLAERLVQAGLEVLYVTPEDSIAGWTVNTLDYRHIQKRLRELGVRLLPGLNLQCFAGEHAELACVWSGAVQQVACRSVLTVTARLPDDALYQDLLARQSAWQDHGISAIDCIGDALAPGLIAHAVYAGHRYAREFDDPRDARTRRDSVPFRRRRFVAS